MLYRKFGVEYYTNIAQNMIPQEAASMFISLQHKNYTLHKNKAYIFGFCRKKYVDFMYRSLL